MYYDKIWHWNILEIHLLKNFHNQLLRSLFKFNFIIESWFFSIVREFFFGFGMMRTLISLWRLFNDMHFHIWACCNNFYKSQKNNEIYYSRKNPILDCSTSTSTSSTSDDELKLQIFWSFTFFLLKNIFHIKMCFSVWWVVGGTIIHFVVSQLTTRQKENQWE